MPARAYWKGYLRLSLVTIGVELYSAVNRMAELEMHQIHKKSGKRIRYEKVAPGVGAVKAADIVKGVEVEKGEYVTLTPDEMDDIKLESRRTIDLVQFVDHCEIDPRYYDRPYYVIPTADDVAAEGFAVIREALRDRKKVGLGQMATRGRDAICAVKACGDGLLLETLRYEKEVKDSDKIFDSVPSIRIDKEMMHLAADLIAKKSAPFKPEKFHSHYKKALEDLIAEKKKHGKVSHVEDEELGGGAKVIDLMEALRASVKSGKRTPAKHAAAARKAPAKKVAKKAPAKKAVAKRKAG